MAGWSRLWELETRGSHDLEKERNRVRDLTGSLLRITISKSSGRSDKGGGGGGGRFSIGLMKMKRN